MAIFKCKMCGGDLNISADDKIVECEYCGTTQTVPSADNEKKMTLFNRANRLRLNSEFDKAAVLYEQIIAEFPEEAEAYWGLCLCNYGIEYVDDPATGKKIPTCHRASFQKLREDENFNLAMEYSDAIAQKVYRDEAREIDRINAEILSVSRSEKPYDVFICYKETDDFGGRTPDSVMAQEVYDALTDKGYKVFFSRITLEDKLGLQYEPYIFAALNSAKVMLAFGTKYEYFHAVWVKNEWNRFLKLAAKDKTKKLIPVYKDMDPYDLPDEFKALQAQDMGKLGAVQDLVRGVGKLLTNKDKPVQEKETVVVQTVSNGVNVSALLERAFLFLEDGKWDKADEYCEKVLDNSPKCAEAYLGKLMAELQIRKRENLKDAAEPFDGNDNCKKASHFDEIIAKELAEITEQIRGRIEEERREDIYLKATSHAAKWTEIGYRRAAALFKSISGYKDADEKAAQCLARAEDERKDAEARKEAERKEKEAREEADRKAREAAIPILAEKRKQIAPVQGLIACSPNVDFPQHLGCSVSGRVFTSGNDKYRNDARKWNHIDAISVGLFHVLGLSFDGTVVAAGDNQYGQCNVAGWRNVYSITAGGWHSVALKPDGTVVAAGNNEWGQCEIKGWKDIVQIATGRIHTVGLRKDGTVVAVGHKDNGRCNVASWTDISKVFAFNGQTVGLKRDGCLIICSPDGGISVREEFIDVSMGYEGYLALRKDGTVLYEPYFDHELKKYQKDIQNGIESWRDIIAVSAKNIHCAGLKADGTVVTAGTNDSGQCNTAEWKNIVAVSVSDFCTLGLTSEGKILCAGHDDRQPYDSLTSWKLFSNCETISEDRRQAKAEYLAAEKEKVLRRIAELQQEKRELETELPTLKGLFKANRRKEVEARLAVIEVELKKEKEM